MTARASSSNLHRPLVTLSVVSHGDGAPLQDFLRTLAQYETGAQLQLIITDNLGQDLPALDASPWQSLTLLRNTRPAGYARNHNAAFALAQGTYFCVANPDVRFVQQVFVTLVSAIEAGEGAIAGPLIIDSRGTIQDSFRQLPSPHQILDRGLRRWAPLHGYVVQEQILRPDWIAGIFMLLHRETFAHLHGFDTRYHLYFEDVDLCTRARLLGLHSIVNTNVRVEHDARRSSHRQGRYLFWHIQSMLRFFTSAVYREAQLAEDRGQRMS